MRTVVSNYDVVSLWMEQNQPHARNRSGSLYFRGQTIYSYGPHFPIARFIPAPSAMPDGCHRGVLFTDYRPYSVTTACHMSLVRGRISDNFRWKWKVPKIYPSLLFSSEDVRQANNGERLSLEDESWYKVDSIRQMHRDNLSYFQRCIDEAFERMMRSLSSRRFRLDHLEDVQKSAEDYCRFFNIQHSFRVPEYDRREQLVLADYFDAIERWRFLRRYSYHREEVEEYLQRYNHALRRWHIGEVVDLPHPPPMDGAPVTLPLSIRPWNGEVQTSCGLQVAVSDFAGLLPLVRAGVERKWGIYTRVDGKRSPNVSRPRFGRFFVHRVTARGDVYLDIGCRARYFLRRQEVERVAAMLGMWPEGERVVPEWFVTLMSGLDELVGVSLSCPGTSPRRRSLRLLPGLEDGSVGSDGAEVGGEDGEEVSGDASSQLPQPQR
jgi:hypothetical protein